MGYEYSGGGAWRSLFGGVRVLWGRSLALTVRWGTSTLGEEPGAHCSVGYEYSGGGAWRSLFGGVRVLWGRSLVLTVYACAKYPRYLLRAICCLVLYPTLFPLLFGARD